MAGDLILSPKTGPTEELFLGRLTLPQAGTPRIHMGGDCEAAGTSGEECYANT